MTPLVLTSTTESVPDTPGPRQDFVLLANTLGATILYPPQSGAESLMARIEKRTAADLRQAFAALKQRKTVSTYVSLSEKVGVPLALLMPKNRNNRPAHVLVAHHLTSSNKRTLQQRTGYLNRFDRIVSLGSTQFSYLVHEANYPKAQIARIRHAVDTHFWIPGAYAPSPEFARVEGSYILAVGRERRDYETLAEALRTLPNVTAIIVASSPWSRQSGQAPIANAAPSNMLFQRGLSFVQLRNLYRGAALVVVPIEAGITYAAGSTGCLEGMAMAKPVLATETPGLVDYQRNDTGQAMVAMVAANATALATTIQTLLADQPQRDRLAHAGRQFVEQEANTDHYVAALAKVVQGV